MLPILLTITLTFVLLTWHDLHKGLFVLMAVLPSYLLRTEVLGVPTTLLEMLIVAFLVVWVVKRCSILGEWKDVKPTVLLTPLLLLLTATLSIFISPDVSSALGVWKSYFLEPILLFFVVRYELTHTSLTPTKLFQALGLSALVVSLFAMVQWFTGAGIPVPWDIERRVTSIFDYPNALGLFLGPIAVIAFLSIRQAGATSWFWLATAVTSSVAIVLAQSEAAIVSIVAVLLIAGFLNKKTRIASSSLLILLVFLVFLLPPLTQKLTLQDYSGQVRLSQWSETVHLLSDHWFLGAGLSGYPTALEPYHQVTHLEIFQYPHNLFLNIWVELGILGLLVFFVLAYQILRIFATTYNLQPTSLSLLPFFALLQMTIHGLVDVPYFKNDLAMLTWILLAVICAYAISTNPTSKNST